MEELMVPFKQWKLMGILTEKLLCILIRLANYSIPLSMKQRVGTEKKYKFSSPELISEKPGFFF